MLCQRQPCSFVGGDITPISKLLPVAKFLCKFTCASSGRDAAVPGSAFCPARRPANARSASQPFSFTGCPPAHASTQLLATCATLAPQWMVWRVRLLRGRALPPAHRALAGAAAVGGHGHSKLAVRGGFFAPEPPRRTNSREPSRARLSLRAVAVKMGRSRSTVVATHALTVP